MTMPGTPVRVDVAEEATHGTTSPAGVTTLTSRPVPNQSGPPAAVSVKRAKESMTASCDCSSRTSIMLRPTSASGAQPVSSSML